MWVVEVVLKAQIFLTIQTQETIASDITSDSLVMLPSPKQILSSRESSTKNHRNITGSQRSLRNINSSPWDALIQNRPGSQTDYLHKIELFKNVPENIPRLELVQVIQLYFGSVCRIFYQICLSLLM
eukprot:UN32168